MKLFLQQKKWSPYLVGALIGILSWVTFFSVNKPIGVTTAFENTMALTQENVFPNAAAQNVYFQKPEKTPKIDWEWFFVVGIFGGAFFSSRLSGDRTNTSIPPLWRERFGGNTTKRFLYAFGGGALMMLGARLAQGCTSGHIISGALQLAVSSWVFAATVFIVGILVARTIYGKGVKFYG